MSKVGTSDSKNTLYCSFCGKSQHEVRKLIAGPTVFICDECVELCMEIIPVARLDDVTAKALVRAPVPIVWEEDTKVPVKADGGDEAAGGLTAH